MEYILRVIEKGNKLFDFTERFAHRSRCPMHVFFGLSLCNYSYYCCNLVVERRHLIRSYCPNVQNKTILIYKTQINKQIIQKFKGICRTLIWNVRHQLIWIWNWNVIVALRWSKQSVFEQFKIKIKQKSVHDMHRRRLRHRVILIITR